MPILLLACFVGLESLIILQAVHRIGGGPTLAWLVIAAIAGGWLIVRTGILALRRVQLATARGELPALEIFKGLIIGFAGLMLLLPGLLTDILALSLILAGGRLMNGLATKLNSQMASARPDLKQPVTLDGEFTVRPPRKDVPPRIG